MSLKVRIWFLQDLDSDEEWNYLVEVTDYSGKLSVSSDDESRVNAKLLADDAFRERVDSGLETAITQVLDGMLEGASRMRQIIRLLKNLFASEQWWVCGIIL